MTTSKDGDASDGVDHYDLEGNILHKLHILQEFGFYGPDRPEVANTDSCGAHSPKVKMARPDRALSVDLATSAIPPAERTHKT